MSETKQEPKTNTVRIICDIRECASQVNLELEKLSSLETIVEIKLEQLSVGDYILSDDVVIERKTISDLETSIIDGRVFSQLQNLIQAKKPGLIIEGDQGKLFSDNSRIQKKALIGLITSIGLDYKLPIFFTRNQKETAEFLLNIAKREQLGNGNNIMKLRFAKTRMNFSQRQLFILESFPDVGPTLAKSILKEFKTIRNVANASITDLKKVPKLGPKKADKIKYLFERKFGDNKEEDD
jgi:Fanconi anemia group M protein